jgi:hypothetical protein
MHREWGPPSNEAEANGPYTVDACLAEWEDGVLAASLSKEELNGAATWPASPELVDALRAALADQRGNYAGERLAFALVRCGCRAPETLTALNRWDALPFRWHAAGFTAATLLARLREAGMAGAVADADLARLDAWLDDPATAVTRRAPGYAGSILMQAKVVTMALHDNDGEVRYKELLEAWAGAMSPPLVLKNLVQKNGALILNALPADMLVSVRDILPTRLKDNPEFTLSETFWKLSCTCNGKAFEFFVAGDYAHLNDGALAAEFKLLLRRLRRPERVHRLAEVRAGSPAFWGNYVVADPATVFPICAALGIPLQEMRTSVRPKADPAGPAPVEL